MLLSIDYLGLHLVVNDDISPRGLLVILQLALHLVHRSLGSFLAQGFLIHHVIVLAYAHLLLRVHCLLFLQVVVLDSLVVLAHCVFLSLVGHLLLVLLLLQSCSVRSLLNVW